MIEWLSQPWPWWVAGPLTGLMVPALLLVGGRQFGISSNLRTLCAAAVPGKNKFLRYDWRTVGAWNLVFALGIMLGAWFASTALADPEPMQVAEATQAELAELGIERFDEMIPSQILSWDSLFTFPGFVLIVIGGLLVGFGAAWAGGCTSGHAVMGLASFELPSLLAVLGFFGGGLRDLGAAPLDLLRCDCSRTSSSARCSASSSPRAR